MEFCWTCMNVGITFSDMRKLDLLQLGMDPRLDPGIYLSNFGLVAAVQRPSLRFGVKRM